MINAVPQPLGLTISHDYRAPRQAELCGGDVVAVTHHSNGSTAPLVADVSAKGSEGDAFAAWLATVFRIATQFVPRPVAAETA